MSLPLFYAMCSKSLFTICRNAICTCLLAFLQIFSTIRICE